MASQPKRLIVYVAGPYTPQKEGDIDAKMREVEMNLRRSVRAAEDVIRRGHIPLIPHTHTNGFAIRTQLSQCSDLYYAWDYEILRRCDAIYRYGRSFGADREWEWAKEFGLLRVTMVSRLPQVEPFTLVDG